MKNNQLIPFERNRYYAGKMLTSSDFQAEQTYFNNKRRFINSLVYGSGIICGCNVFSLDDLSVLLESGAAIDDFGREIVIQSSAVKKLSSIEGFSEIQSDEVLLCLRYEETPVHSVFAVSRQNQEDSYEYNRINEGYGLFLKDADEAQPAFELENEFFIKNRLFANKDFTVEMTMPSVVCKGSFAKVHVKLKKLSRDASMKISWSGMLQTPSFLTKDGTHELPVSFEEVVLDKGEEAERDYWIEAERTEEEEANMVFCDENGNRSFKIRLRDGEPEDLIMEELGKTSLEMLGLEEKKDYIPIARLRLLRTDSAYIIDRIEEHGVKKYICAPGWEKKRRQYEAYFARNGHQNLIKDQKETEKQSANQVLSKENNAPLVATGTVEIPLGANAKKGEVYYSGEVMHGLGRGNVYVELGYESYAADAALGGNVKSTVYGNVELFEEDAEGVSNVETAVKVLNDKGSFIVAVKLLKNVDCLILTYRWVAVLFSAGEESWVSEDYGNKSITAESPTVMLGARESYYFNVRFHNMEKCGITYELTESGSGEITADGVYTAPRKEGVYEIRMYCTDIPVICTYAYAIVRGKKDNDKERE